MEGTKSMKTINGQEARIIHLYENTRERMRETYAAV